MSEGTVGFAAPAAGPSSGEELAARFLAHRAVTLELAGRLPPAAREFRPWEKAMSTAELLRHMASAHHFFVGVAQGGPVSRPDPASLPQDLPGLLRLLQEWTEQDAAAIRGLTAAQLSAAVTFRDRTMPARAALDLGREHEIHHKGQLFIYARLLGVEPPAWIRRDR